MLTVSSSSGGLLDHEEDVLCSSEMSISIYQLTGPNIPDVTVKTFKFFQQTL